MRAFLSLFSRFYLGSILIFLYVPVMVMAAMAFNRSPLYEMPFTFDLVWFRSLIGNDRLLGATLNSILIALANTFLASIIGTMAALALGRYRFRGRAFLYFLLLPPIAIPWLIVGTAMLLFFFWIGIGRGLHAILLGHVALSLPYVILLVAARMRSFGSVLEEAAASLGAPPLQVFWRVTLPILGPGIAAGGLFAFAISFDQFVISYFLAPPGVSTLPVEIYSAIRKGFTPEINAISTLIIVASMGIMLLTMRLSRFGASKR